MISASCQLKAGVSQGARILSGFTRGLLTNGSRCFGENGNFSEPLMRHLGLFAASLLLSCEAWATKTQQTAGP
jgi:hypothetical protein